MKVSPFTPKRRRAPIQSLESSWLSAAAPWLCLVAIFAAVSILVSPFYFRLPPVLEPGARIAETIVAEVPFAFESAEARAAWEEERRLRHDQVYVYDSRAEDEARLALEELLERTAGTAADPSAEGPPPPPTLLADLSAAERAAAPGLAASPAFRQALLNTLRRTYTEFIVTESKTQYLGHVQRGVARIVNLDRAPAQAVEAARLVSFPLGWREMTGNLLRDQFSGLGVADPHAGPVALAMLAGAVVPGLSYDEERTLTARERFQLPVPKQRYETGAVLLDASEGRRVASASDAEMLAAHRAAVERDHRYRLGAHLGYVAVVFILFGTYIRKFRQTFKFSVRELLLQALPVLLALAISFPFVLFSDSDTLLAAGIFPAGVVGMLGVLLLDMRFALQLVTWGCILYGLQSGMRFDALAVSLFGGYTAVAALHSIRERREVVLAGFYIGAVNAASLAILHFIERPEHLSQLFGTLPVLHLLLAFVAGVATALVTIAVLPLIEIAFDVTTDLRLLELSGLQHPLLLKLEDEAPGTWQHTLNVAKLAEAAATEIGVNALLVRTGCLFHDIGKMSKPEYFTENQVTADDKMRHTTLKPQISTLIIRNHVKEGVEMAKRAGLPERVMDFIPQHHGTCLITYFYGKALSEAQRGDKRETVREDDYRYPGPKPQSIEAAIVMLADAVEATSTAKFSSRTVRPEEVRQLVHAIVMEKFNDGQFDECNMTMSDLNSIRESLVRTLLSRFHTRIDYPKVHTAAEGQRALG
ncbi:MAG: HDIG domain-containing protein [Candidatus Sumerlaeia bacterium]|nr:HDIG domain-containing protein [Candidatus Sumerlaeia bacterium]